MADNIKYTRASLLSDNTFEFSSRNPAKIVGIDGDEQARAREQAARALQGLNELQKRGKGPVSVVSLSCGLQYLLEQAPLTSVSLVPPECDIFADGEDFGPVRRALESADWLLWVVGTGDRHYVVIIVRLDPVPKEPRRRKNNMRAKRQVGAWAVVDPTGDHGSVARTRRVTDRLQAVMSTPRLRERVDGFDPRTERRVAVPALPGHDVWSSGLRAFGLVDAVLQRLTTLAFRAADPGEADEAAVWAPVPPHFNGVRARNDLMTSCAHQVRKATEWGLRLALAPVRAAAAKGGKKGGRPAPRPAHEERFEPARGFGFSPDDVWSSDEAESEDESPVRPSTPSFTGPPSREPSPPPAPRKKRGTFRVRTNDEDEDAPVPKRRKPSTPSDSPLGRIAAKKSRAFTSAVSAASPTPSDGFVQSEQGPANANDAMQAHSDGQARCITDNATSPDAVAPPVANAPASADDTTVNAPAILHVSIAYGAESSDVSPEVPESPVSEEE